ncbi:hypothetical protein ARHIZOSPH14_26910 [Agromyces rhizosphaerae]|uniref:Uncharacterized protein n=1 Tax=Agromyces rhizosphaerae TaxID=88374 RepID=A0A9W6D048_9MICO|nr:hypothetical protein [Agromyces rhizosphaerae]GLI28449.1 hypothetical protein ARHIZOSPH14_26910 [Agromyces rhizosphaerae]
MAQLRDSIGSRASAAGEAERTRGAGATGPGANDGQAQAVRARTISSRRATVLTAVLVPIAVLTLLSPILFAVLTSNGTMAEAAGVWLSVAALVVAAGIMAVVVRVQLRRR